MGEDSAPSFEQRQNGGNRHMAKTSAAVKNRYAAKAYDSLRIIVPKGQKQAVEAHAQGKGQSVNGYVNGLIRADMGLTEEEWKNMSTE